jgi:hypothetical protein
MRGVSPTFHFITLVTFNVPEQEALTFGLHVHHTEFVRLDNTVLTKMGFESHFTDNIQPKFLLSIQRN